MLPPILPKSDHADLHLLHSYDKLRYSSAVSIARASSANPASTSLRWTRSARRPRSTSTSRSPLRLRRLHHAEAVGMAGHVDIGGIVAGDLQEHAGIRAALVGLPGRMLEARPEAEAGGGAGLVADARAHRGQRLRVRFVALDIGQQRDIVAGFAPACTRPKWLFR